MTADTQQILDIVATPAWSALQQHHDEIGDKHLREFFDEDPGRGTELALSVGDLYIDYSKHRVTRETLKLLIDLARAAGLERRRDAMFSGVHINTSEDRAVLHTALRLPRDAGRHRDAHEAGLQRVRDELGRRRLQGGRSGARRLGALIRAGSDQLPASYGGPP